MLSDFSTRGAVVEFAGERWSGKTFLMHTICSLNSLRNLKTFYVDSSGSFDPELIYNYLKNLGTIPDEKINEKLKNITHIRLYEPDDIFDLIQKLRILEYSCLVFDDLLSLFYYRNEKSLKIKIRRIIKELAMLAVLRKVCIVFTNTIVNNPNNKFPSLTTYELRYNDILRYIHIKAIIRQKVRNSIVCEFIYPIQLEKTKMVID